MSFDMMVLFGDHVVLFYGILGNCRLKSNEYVLFDLGVIYEYYCSDMICIIKFGEFSKEV